MTIRNIFSLTALVLSWLAAAPHASADIVQSSFQFAAPFYDSFGDMDISNFGQSFTATAAEPNVGVVAFQYTAVNGANTEYPTISARIYEGIGFGGSLLGTSNSFAVNEADLTWIDFTFSSPVVLTTGNQYSIRFTLADPQLAWRGGFLFDSPSAIDDRYAGGVRLNGEGALADGPTNAGDLAFRVVSVAAVPEASSWLMTGGAALASLTLGLIRVRRFRRRLTA